MPSTCWHSQNGRLTIGEVIPPAFLSSFALLITITGPMCFLVSFNDISLGVQKAYRDKSLFSVPTANTPRGLDLDK